MDPNYFLWKRDDELGLYQTKEEIYVAISVNFGREVAKKAKIFLS